MTVSSFPMTASLHLGSRMHREYLTFYVLFTLSDFLSSFILLFQFLVVKTPQKGIFAKVVIKWAIIRNSFETVRRCIFKGSLTLITF